LSGVCAMSTMVSMHAINVSILAILFLSACGTIPRVTLYEERQEKASVRPLPAGSLHIVQQNDSIYGIARRYGLSTRSIISSNGLKPPYRLAVGQRLKLSRPNLYKVAPGDTLYGISRRYRVSMRQLAYLNGLKSPYKIISGDDLVLPEAIEGERTKKIRKAEQIDREKTILEPSRPRLKRGLVDRLPLKKSSKKAPGIFVWPVEGQLISRFGAKGKGLHNDGINLAAPRGTRVQAAQSGVVAYAGNELRGFGNLVLIRHKKGLMSAYAHNETVLVKLGDMVQRGQTIARVGSTGSVDRPQLHFEIRKGREAIDPLRFLQRQAANLIGFDRFSGLPVPQAIAYKSTAS